MKEMLRNPLFAVGLTLVALALILSATAGSNSTLTVLCFCAGGALIGVGLSQRFKK